MAKKKTANIFVWALLGLLMFSLVGFGVTNFGGSVRSAATVGDTEIDLNRYGRELQNEMRAIGAQTGEAITMQQARDFGIDQAVLTRLVAQAAVENEAARLGISAGDEAVSEQILAIPAFRGFDGEFNREAYQFTLESSGLSVGEFEDRVRAETASSLIQGAIIAGAGAPETYLDTVLDYVLEARDVTWAELGAEALSEPIAEPSEDDLRAFHETNAETFTLPETRVITYAWLTPDMIRDTVEIDETALEELYQQRIDEFVVPERRLVERLVFGSAADAEAALARIESGEITFEALVAERGLELADIDLGDVSREDLGAAADPVFGLAEPGVTGPHDSDLGPALFRMNAILAARETSRDEAEEELRAELAADRARRVILDAMSDIDDLLAGGATLEDLAAETEMELGSIDWRADVSDGIAAYESFRAAAPTIREDDFPELLTLEDGGIFAMRLDETRPPALQPLNEVRPQVIAGWEAAETVAALRAEAETTAERLASLRDLEGDGLTLQSETGITRDGFVGGTPPAFVDEVFGMEPGEVRVIDGENAVFVVRLDAVRAPEITDPATLVVRQALTQQTEQEIANDVLTAYTNALIATSGVQVNQAALNAIHAQFP